MKLGKIILILIILLPLVQADSVAVDLQSIIVVANASNVDDKHKGEIEILSGTTGDPDRPIISGKVYNKGIDNEDIGVEIVKDSVQIELLQFNSQLEPSGFDEQEKQRILDSLKVDSIDVKGSGDVIIKGSKIKENSEVSQSLTILNNDPSKVRTDVDLHLFAAKQANADRNMETITLNFKKISVSYKQPGRFLGIIPVEIKEEVSVEEIYTDEYGRIKVKMPWWHFLTSKSLTKADLVAGLEEERNKRQLDATQFENANQRQAQYIALMSSVLKQYHESSLDFVKR